MTDPGLLGGAVVIVTGAGRGIGAATARVLAGHGATVVLNHRRDAERARAVARSIEAGPGRAVCVRADVLDPDQVDAMVTEVVARFGRVDGVVNNAIAGVQHAPLDRATAEDYRTAFDYGCTAVVNLTKAVRPVMAAAGGGRIVNIVTELWDGGPGGFSVYLAGKGAMVGVSRSLAAELGPDNITVNMVAPGWTTDGEPDDEADGATDGEAVAAYVESTPLRRRVTPEAVGNACAFFLSRLADDVTGAYLPVTGGRVRQG